MAYYPQFFQPYQQPMQAQQVQQQAPMQSNGFIPVRSEAEARNYPVAYGLSVTFKDENAPFVYTKTMGFSQLDTPRFEKYRLVKEDADLPKTATESSNVINLSADELNSKFGAIWTEIDAIKRDLYSKPTTAPSKKKKEVSEDDATDA